MLYVLYGPKRATESSYKLDLRLYQTIIHTNYLNSETICIVLHSHSTICTSDYTG